MTHHCEDLGINLAASSEGGNITRIHWANVLPRAYGKLTEIALDDPADWPPSDDPRMRQISDGILPRFDEGPIRVVFPHPQGDRIGAVLEFRNVANLRETVAALAQLADRAEENHDPAAVRAQLPCKTCNGYGSIPDGPEDGQECPDCTPAPPPGEVVLADESPF